MLKAVILDYQSLAPADLDLHALWRLPVAWTLHDYTDPSATASRISGQDVVLTNKVVLDGQMLRNNPGLKLVIILATGTNNVDLAAAAELGIPVCNIVAYSTESVVQHTFALLLALQTRLVDYHQAVQQGEWCRSRFFGLLTYPIGEVAGKTLGIIGYGAIGKRVGEVARAMGMKVLVAKSLVPAPRGYEESQVSDRSLVSGALSGSDTSSGSDVARQRVSLAQLYAEADVISIHCPLSPYSRNLIDAAALAQMKAEAIVFNLGRGGIIDEHALAQALRSGVIRAAATDVLTEEPPAPSHVLLDKTIPGLIVTPHVAWASREARQELLDQVVNILQSFAQGKIINQVHAP